MHSSKNRWTQSPLGGGVDSVCRCWCINTVFVCHVFSAVEETPWSLQGPFWTTSATCLTTWLTSWMPCWTEVFHECPKVPGSGTEKTRGKEGLFPPLNYMMDAVRGTQVKRSSRLTPPPEHQHLISDVLPTWGPSLISPTDWWILPLTSLKTRVVVFSNMNQNRPCFLSPLWEKTLQIWMSVFH